jgi:HEAT repeat protein
MDQKIPIMDRLKSAFLGDETFEYLLRQTKNPDGYKRENAVRRLGMLGNPAALPYLIVRANDWVPEVRKGAYDAILNLRKQNNVAHFITALPDLLRLERCLRADHRGLIAEVEDYLVSDENRQILIAQMTAENAIIAKIVCIIVLKRRLLGAEEAISKCLSHADVIVRSMAANNFGGLNSAAFEAILPRALSDAYMPVRREAFQQLLLRDRKRGLEIARTFLFDRHMSVREIALNNLMHAGVGVAAIYDEAFESAKRVRTIVCILWGWAALNRTLRVDDIKQYLNHRSPTLRRAALQALTKIISIDALPHLLTALRDEAQSVCTESSRQILKLDSVPSVEQLIPIAVGAHTLRTVRACCNIAAGGNKWDWLHLTLAARKGESNESIVGYLDDQIRDWNDAFNRSGTQPTDRQLTAIVENLREADMDPASIMRFTLKSYGAKFE